jgi:hypothetical protein
VRADVPAATAAKLRRIEAAIEALEERSCRLHSSQ